jgi:hypothetical protein
MKVWTRRGRSESNELEIEVTSSEVLHLRCRWMVPPIGLSKLPQQTDVIKTTMKSGAARGLELYEDGRFLSH